MPVRVIEIRNYRLRPGVREDFIDYFENHFLDSQEEVGVRILGQFRLVGQPDRFVWIRGFEDMVQRRQALEAFYGGPYWRRWKGPANDMMIEWDRVHLLRPRGGSWPLAERIRHSPSEEQGEPVKIVATFYREGAWSGRGSVLEAHGHTILGEFVTETAENDFPQLPVIQEPDLLLVLSLRPESGKQNTLEDHPEATEVLELEPTARSGLCRGSPAVTRATGQLRGEER